MTESDSGHPDRFEAALTHVSTIYGLYVTQRQNLANFFLVGVAFLTAAYGVALKDHRPVAMAVCVVGVLASFGVFLQDRRLKKMMELAELPLCELQGLLAEQLAVESVRIQKAVHESASRWATRGNVARATYLTVAIAFGLGICYARH